MRARGFTLVELLIALTLISLISVFLFGGLRYTEQTAARGMKLLDRASDLGLAANFLRATFSDARPLPEAPNNTADDTRDIAFSGRADEIALTSVPPPHLASSGFYRVEIALNRKTHALTARWSPLAAGANDPDYTVPPVSTLLDGVSRVEFGYFGTEYGEAASAWHDTWEAQRALPRLIRLRIDFDDGSAAPAVVVAVRTADGAAR